MITMYHIYHGVPEQIIGNELMPLNDMHAAMPELRQQYLEKYIGREEILERKIPLLNCLWNDVVQFLPLHPRKVFELQKQLGLISTIPSYKYFEIDLSKLDPDKTVVFFKTAPGEENVTVQWLRDVDFDAIQEVPPATISYFNSLVGTGEPPFNYQFIPHVVHEGKLNVSGSRVIVI
jgi:hypothetical protein